MTTLPTLAAMTKTRFMASERFRPSDALRLSIGVTLRSVSGQMLEPAPQRSLVASPRHTFADLALSIDEAFGRWELGHLREFSLEDGVRVGDVVDTARAGQRLDYRSVRLQRLRGGERFRYTFEFDDRWAHDCMLIGTIDPVDVLAEHAGHPIVYQSMAPRPQG